MNTLFGIVIKFWIWGIQLLVIWLVIAAFVPGISWYEHVNMLMSTLIINPALYIFDFFEAFSKSLLASNWDDNTPIQDFVNLLLVLVGIACALVLPLMFWFMWFIISLVALGGFVPKSYKCSFELGPEGENAWHLSNGRTTIQDTYDAEVKANAIASALNKHR